MAIFGKQIVEAGGDNNKVPSQGILPVLHQEELVKTSQDIQPADLFDTNLTGSEEPIDPTKAKDLASALFNMLKPSPDLTTKDGTAVTYSTPMGKLISSGLANSIGIDQTLNPASQEFANLNPGVASALKSIGELGGQTAQMLLLKKLVAPGVSKAGEFISSQGAKLAETSPKASKIVQALGENVGARLPGVAAMYGSAYTPTAIRAISGNEDANVLNGQMAATTGILGSAQLGQAGGEFIGNIAKKVLPKMVGALSNSKTWNLSAELLPKLAGAAGGAGAAAFAATKFYDLEPEDALKYGGTQFLLMTGSELGPAVSRILKAGAAERAKINPNSPTVQKATSIANSIDEQISITKAKEINDPAFAIMMKEAKTKLPGGSVEKALQETNLGSLFPGLSKKDVEALKWEMAAKDTKVPKVTNLGTEYKTKSPEQLNQAASAVREQQQNNITRQVENEKYLDVLQKRALENQTMNSSPEVLASQEEILKQLLNGPVVRKGYW